MRVGIGYAVQDFDPARVLHLGGLKVPGCWGLRGRGDGDVLLQAIVDAILGAGALGGIEDHFPGEDAAWRDAPSAPLVAEALTKLRLKGFVPAFLDATLIADRPVLGPQRAEIQARLASLLGLDVTSVNLKRTGHGGLGGAGLEDGVAAQVALTVVAEEPA